MYFFNHAQPALLYLVPCTLISSTFTALINKDIKTLWKFNEEKLDEEDDDSDEDNNEEDKRKKNE